MVHTFQPPSSSKREFHSEASLSWRQHSGPYRREDFEFWALWKPEIWTLLNVVLSQVIPRKFNVALTRSSHLQMTFKIGVLTDFANFTGKQLCWNLYFIKMQASTLQFCWKETPTQLSSSIICETFKNNLFHRTPPVAASDCLREKFSE